MKLTTEEIGDVVILSLDGKIMGSLDDNSLIDTICELAENGKTKVVLSLSGLEWMNSRGLGMCISGLTTLRNRGGDLKLVNAPDQLITLMKKCHIHSLFATFDSVEEAVASF